MKVIECWVVYEWDGGERQNFAYRVSKEKFTYDEIKSSIGKQDHVKQELIVIFDSILERDENNIQALRRSAWEKLTPLERKVLNLEEPK